MKKSNIIRRLFTITATSALLFSAGCSDWLDVRPRNEMKEKDIYKTAEGFRQVLTGAYLDIAGTALYGQNMTMTFPEYLAQHWNLVANKISTFVSNYDYSNTNVESLVSSIWNAYYNAIAHLNNLLAHIDGSSALFTEYDYNLIKGEALGLRGFLHFELLRIFGPVPALATDGEKAIPYVTEFTKEADKLTASTYGDVVKFILRDLNDAERLLADDPLATHTAEFLNSPDNKNLSEFPDIFYYYRQNRFNLYAAKAAKARYYLWIGDKPNARECALEVIAAKNENGESKFRLAVESDLNAVGKENRTMTKEHIFAVYNSQLSSIADNNFFSSTGLTKTQRYITNAECFGSDSPNDIRNKGQRYWEDMTFSSGTVTVYNKYRQNIDEQFRNVVPVIRLAEMYLIAMESAESPTEALGLFRTFRISRNMDESTESTFDPAVQIEREYRKDFYAEGQMFWYYKRINKPSISWGVARAIAMTPEKYVVPQPDSQSVFEPQN